MRRLRRNRRVVHEKHERTRKLCSFVGKPPTVKFSQKKKKEKNSYTNRHDQERLHSSILSCPFVYSVDQISVPHPIRGLRRGGKVRLKILPAKRCHLVPVAPPKPPRPPPRGLLFALKIKLHGLVQLWLLA